VHHSESLPITYGLGLYALLGGGANFPQSTTNPITNVTGPIYSSASALAIQPSLSVQLTDRLAVGAGPIISSMSMGLNPAFFAPNGDGSFPIATPGRPFWGGGFQLGFLYDVSADLDFGFSYKSPIWFETFKYNAQDELGNPRELFLDLSVPQIFSTGIAYHGLCCSTIALDVRYLDYKNSTLFGDAIVAPGLRWDSVWAVGVGIERWMSDRLALRAGYLFNENPIPDIATLFNMQLPTFVQQQVALGSSVKMAEAITMDLAVVYGFSSSIEGPVPIPPGGLGNADIAMKMDAVSLAFSLRFDY
jgi:long-chain fatty acid transport protein